MSLNGHKENCSCAPCGSRRAGEAQRKATAELAATRRDIARLQVHDAGGPDALLAKARVMGDPGLAARILEAAGFDVGEITSRWRADAAPAQSRSSFWDQFPDHDRDFMAGRRQLPDVAADYDARQRERQAQRQSPVMWRTRDGTPVTDLCSAAVIGASYGPSGAPVQRSVVSESTPELGSEQL